MARARWPCSGSYLHRLHDSHPSIRVLGRRSQKTSSSSPAPPTARENASSVLSWRRLKRTFGSPFHFSPCAVRKRECLQSALPISSFPPVTAVSSRSSECRDAPAPPALLRNTTG